MIRELCAVAVLLLVFSLQLDAMGINMGDHEQPQGAIGTLPGGICTGRTTLHWRDRRRNRSRTYNHQQGKRGVNRIRLGRGGRQTSATSSGNCCWKFHSRTAFRGITFVLNLGQRAQLPFEVRSLKTIDCPSRGQNKAKLW